MERTKVKVVTWRILGVCVHYFARELRQNFQSKSGTTSLKVCVRSCKVKLSFERCDAVFEHQLLVVLTFWLRPVTES